MGYQSKTYSLSDEVVEAIEGKKAAGTSPDRFLWSLIFKQKKPSKREQVAEALRASDPMADERPEIAYGAHEELPSGGSVAVVGAARPVERTQSARKHSLHSGTRPIAGCSECAALKPKDRKP